MAGGVRLKLHKEDLDKALAKVERSAKDMHLVWEDIGAEAVDSVQENFDAEGRPEKWVKWSTQYGNWRVKKAGKARKSRSKKRGRHSGEEKILTLSGRLRHSITAQAHRNSVLIGTNVSYAAAHNYGYKSIPQREFLVIQDHDWIKFAAIVEEHIAGDF